MKHNYDRVIWNETIKTPFNNKNFAYTSSIEMLLVLYSEQLKKMFIILGNISLFLKTLNFLSKKKKKFF